MAALLLIIAFRAPLGRAVVAGFFDIFTGSQISFTKLAAGGGHVRIEGLSLRRGGDPLFEAALVDVGYDLRDLLPGGKRRFGLRSVDVLKPHLTIVRHADGSFNLPSGGGGSSGAAGSSAGTPLILNGTLRDGEIEILDPNRVDPAARRLTVDALNARVALDSATATSYRASATFEGAPLTLAGRIDASRRYALHRLTAPSLPVTTLLNYIVNYRSAHVLSGRVSNLDVIVYSLGSSPAHFGGSAFLNDGAIRIPGLRVPLRDIAARFDLFDGGIASPRIEASVAGVRAQAAGGIYDWQAPAFNLGLRMNGPLATLRSVFNFSAALPLSGDVALRAVVEGAVGEPLVRVDFDSQRVAYRNFPLQNVLGSLIYYNSSLALIRTDARYGPFVAVTRGGLDLGDRATSELVVDGSAPPGTVPFVAQAVPSVPLRVTAVLGGSDLAIDARGVAGGAAGDESVSGLFRIDRSGDGEFGPFNVRAGMGSATGAFYADRSAAQSGFWLDANAFALRRNSANPQLPGLPNLAPPDFDGRVDALLAGEGHPSNFRLAGTGRLQNLVVGRYRIGNVSGAVAGAPADLRASNIVASGPWGAFSGRGAYDSERLALAGRYRGSLQQLAVFTGPLNARGALDAPVALLLSSAQTVVQTNGADLPAGSVRDVPVSDVRGTIAISGKTLRVYAATARVAGGAFAAAGTVGGAGSLGIVLTGADAAHLRNAGSPLERGRIAALGDVRQTAGTLHFAGALSLADGSARGVALSGSSGVALDGDVVALRGGEALVDGSFGRFDGSVAGLGGGPAALDLTVDARDARVAPFARLAVPTRHDIVGTFDARVHVGGTSAAPAVAGPVTLPEGSFQGQAFRDASARVAFDQRGLMLADGSVAVGSTHVGFSAEYRPGALGATLSAPHANLTDFDDLFDTGDTLDGRGSVNAVFSRREGRLATNAQIDFAGLRYLRFNVGDSNAHWSSDGRDVTGSLAFGGDSGRADASGTVLLAPRAPIATLLRHSRFNGQATLRAFDLGTWLPLLGYELPLGGRVDADTRITGSLMEPVLAVSANLAGGYYGKIPIKSFTLQAVASLRSLTLSSAALDLGTMQATGSGVVGLGPADPIALSLHATTTDLAGLGTSFTGAKLALTGAGEADVKLTGSRVRPGIAGGFYVHDATFQTVAIPQALGQFRLEGRSVELESTELVLAKGRVDFAGALPFTFSPFGFGPPDAPVDVEITARALDLSNFVPLLPKGSTLEGLIDGRVSLSGTAGAPRLEGRLTLAGGQGSAPAFEREPLSKVAATLSFDRDAAILENLHAEAGGGVVDANGRATLGLNPSYRLSAVARNLRLDLPAYGRGTLDGNIVLERPAGGSAALGGKVSLQDTVIPFAALSVGTGGDTGTGVPGLVGPVAPGIVREAPRRPNLTLALDVTADRNVRVRSANVDIGGTGALHVGGTLADPQLTGQIDSTGGTLSYFNTVFRVQTGKVTFDPAQGLIPTLDAVATTHVSNPDPNGFRNISGSADITITVKGPVTNLDIQLASTPSYSREQILGLLLGAPSLGANLFDVNGYPSGAVTRNASGQTTIGQQAFSVANAQFTKNLLAPFETQAAGALGLSDINVNVDVTGSVGFTARKGLNKFVNAIFSQTFGYPTRQSFGFEFKPNQFTAAQLTAFTTVGAQTVYIAYPALQYGSQSDRITAAQPSGGTSGLAFSLQLLLP